MATRKVTPATETEYLTKSERLLALLLLHFAESGGQRRKAELLRRAGLTNREIADLLGTTAAVVGQVLYEARKSKARPKRKKR